MLLLALTSFNFFTAFFVPVGQADSETENFQLALESFLDLLDQGFGLFASSGV